ncbi:hypothetical protein CDD83_295 [Cordyceps sp. RAO-2017]|nr:hypothetical protein CDD83_295 [Cordyceps sp. RAO-2017]
MIHGRWAILAVSMALFLLLWPSRSQAAVIGLEKRGLFGPSRPGPSGTGGTRVGGSTFYWDEKAWIVALKAASTKSFLVTYDYLSTCPEDLALEEFKAMATVPVEHRIQWFNILTNLHVPSLDFKKLDTILVLLQSSFQAGPPLKDTAYRAGHQPLGDDVFAGQLLKGPRLAVSRMGENWES